MLARDARSDLRSVCPGSSTRPITTTEQELPQPGIGR